MGSIKNKHSFVFHSVKNQPILEEYMKKLLVPLAIISVVFSCVLVIFNWKYPVTKNYNIVDNSVKFERVINVKEAAIEYCNGDLCLNSFAIFAIANNGKLEGYYYTSLEKEFISTEDEGFGPIFTLENDLLKEVGYIHQEIVINGGFTEFECDIFEHISLYYGIYDAGCKERIKIIEWYEGECCPRWIFFYPPGFSF